MQINILLGSKQKSCVEQGNLPRKPVSDTGHQPRSANQDRPSIPVDFEDDLKANWTAVDEHRFLVSEGSRTSRYQLSEQRFRKPVKAWFRHPEELPTNIQLENWIAAKVS